MMPSFYDIQYFIEVAHSENISRAAERLGITQPSLTMAIQRLEESIGTKLLFRSKKGVKLTPAGKQFLHQSNSLLQSWEQLKGSALSSMTEVQGTYVLGCHSSVGIYSLPDFLAKLLQKYPLLDLHLQHDLSRKILEGVVRMEIDIGLVINPIQHPDLILHKLLQDEVCLWTSTKKTSLNDLSGKEVRVLCDTDLAQSQEILKKMKKQGFTYKNILSSGSLELVAHMTAAGGGIGILPERVVTASTPGKLRKISKSPLFTDELYLVYRAENKNIQAIKTMSQMIQASF